MNFGCAKDTQGGENLFLAIQNLFVAVVCRRYIVFFEILRHYDWGKRKKEKD
jgi:hypothetical protein